MKRTMVEHRSVHHPIGAVFNSYFPLQTAIPFCAKSLQEDFPGAWVSPLPGN